MPRLLVHGSFGERMDARTTAWATLHASAMSSRACGLALKNPGGVC